MKVADIQNSRYGKLWGDDITVLQSLLNTEDLLKTNFSFGFQNFTARLNAIERNEQGVAAYEVREKVKKAAPMADMRAPLSDTQPLDLEGISKYTGTVPSFSAFGFQENGAQRDSKEKLLAQYGNDFKIIMDWVDKVQEMKDSLDSTFSYMAAQLLSTGKIDYLKGRGIKESDIAVAAIPAANRVNAGVKVWSDPDCKLLSQMQKIEKDFRDRTGFAGKMKWQIPFDIYHNIVLKNAEVLELVKSYYVMQKLPFVETMAINQKIFNEVITAADYNMSAIEIVVEGQRDVAWDGTVTKVNGWANNIAVLRPADWAGEIVHATFAEQKIIEKYGASNIKTSFVKTGNSGLYTLVNTTLDNGRFREWHTDLFADFIPALTEFPYHVIVKTNVAD